MTSTARPGAPAAGPCPRRSGATYAGWLAERPTGFRDGIEIATLDPFRGYRNAIADELEDAVAVLDAFHVVKVGLTAMEDTRRRVQQDTTGHRGRKDDPLHKIHRVLRAGIDRLTDRQLQRINTGLADGDPTFEVTIAWHCYQRLRSVPPSPTCTRRNGTPRRSWSPSTPARSRRSPDSAAPYASGARRSSPTSPPNGPATAAPKRSTESSNSSAARPAASATSPTTGYA